MRRHFFGLGIGLKKSTSTIRRPSRDIWNNIHAKHVAGGGMQEHMEKKLRQKIEDAQDRAIRNAVKVGAKSIGTLFR